MYRGLAEFSEFTEIVKENRKNLNETLLLDPDYLTDITIYKQQIYFEDSIIAFTFCGVFTAVYLITVCRSCK